VFIMSTNYFRSVKNIFQSRPSGGLAGSALPSQTHAAPRQPASRPVRQLTRHMWLRYLVAVLLVAGLSVVSYWVVINLNLLNEKGGKLVQASARQLTLAELAGRLALALALPLGEGERAASRERLRQAIDELARQHAALRDGGIEGGLTPAGQAIFFRPPHALDARFLAFKELALRLLAESEFASREVLAADAERVSAAIDGLAPALGELAGTYEQDGVGKIYAVIETETYVVLATLLILLLEVLLIFRPIIGRVRRTAISLQEQASRLEAALRESQTLGERLREEVSHAARLQRSLLPSPDIGLPGLDGVAILTTCTEVGGDYYDYYHVDGRYAVVVIADGSGHGVAAGSLVNSAKIAILQASERGETDPAQILALANRALLASTHDSMFMTMGCLCLDSATGLLRYANAGHVFPYVRRGADGAWQALEASGLPLGRVANADYENVTLTLEPGDRLFLYTDGLVEERTPAGEPFGFELLERLLEEYGEMGSDETAHWIQDALEQHSQSQALSDDVTLLALEHSHRTVGYETTPAPVAAAALTLLADAAYRFEGVQPDARLSRQFMVFTPSGPFADLLPRFCRDGLRRVLPEDDGALRGLGMPALLAQHQPAGLDDLYRLLGECAVQRQFPLTHSDDKAFIQWELAGLLEGQAAVGAGHAEALMFTLDELIENALYGAPRDPANQPLYAKGNPRDIAAFEGVRLDWGLNGHWLGLMVTDSWGTLTPAVFLRRLALNSRLHGLQAGQGGAGLFLAWHLSDYFQVRVFPHRQTQVTALWNLSRPPDSETAPGFQFFYHTETDESCVLDEEPPAAAMSASASLGAAA